MLPFVLLQITHAGFTLSSSHFHAVAACALAAGEFKAAIEHLNGMKRRGVFVEPWLWQEFFVALGTAGRREECHYVWLALNRSAKKIPPWVAESVRSSILLSQGVF